MKRFKILSLIVFTFMSLFVFNDRIFAATATVKATVNKSQVVVGNNVEVTITVSSSSNIGSWEINFTYDTGKLKCVSSDCRTSIIGYASASNQKTATYKYTFQAKSSGSASINITNVLVADYDTVNYMTVNKANTSVKVITQQQLIDSYSKNNNLSSLSVTGAELSPNFNKDTLEYNIILEPNTTKINVNAVLEDSKATLHGVGEIPVSDGENRIEIKVIAENGNEKKYIINATVKELNPISVKINNIEMTIIRKTGTLDPPLGYTETTTLIDGEDVLAYTNDITKFTLVGLKDSSGNTNYYIYDNDEYTLYHEISFNKINLFPLELDNEVTIPKSYSKTKITINDIEVNVYKLNSRSKYALIYGMNVFTGEKHLYMYDNRENTLQIYNDEEIKILEDNLNNFLIIIIILGGLSLLLFVILIGTYIKRHSRKKKKKKEKKLDDNMYNDIDELI